ncbi:MAG: glycerol kinase GlpK [Trueperaceae bacterium]|nr:glycerol kinase GlpK [Trueperaceae bacterium]
MAHAILSLDQGTTSSRAILFGPDGRILSVAQKEFQQHYPRPGWVEHDPHEIWSTQSSVATEVLAQARLEPSQVAAIGIANQRETTVVWDRDTLRPVHNAIVWQDRRTAGLIQRWVDAGLAGEITARTGLIPDAYFSASKIAWILEHVEGARERAEAGRLAFGTIDAWLITQLTRGTVHVTDASNASRTMLYDIHARRWSDELLEAFGIPSSMMPQVVASSGEVGRVPASLFGAEVPIAGIAGDQQAATFGQTCFQPGQGKNTYGTGGFMVMNTGAEPIASRNRLLTTVAWDQGGFEYALEGSIFVAGAVVQWLRDELGILRRSEDVEPLARQAADNGGVYFVPAFTGLGAPHWDPYARGALLGLSRGSGPPEIARAALEGIAFQVHDVIRAMESDADITMEELRVDGGATKNDLLMQIQADLLGIPVVRPEITETTALGAAYLAGLAVGFWSGRDELSAQWREDARFEPDMDRNQRDALLAGWNKAVSRAKDWAEVDA